jgi:dihydrofolate reductase
MSVIAIWARDFYDNTIAIDGKIPWHIPSDLKRFNCITQNSYVIVGRKTYETLPKKDLDGRNFIILTNNQNYEVSNKKTQTILTDINKLNKKDLNDLGNVFVIGGSIIYSEFFSNPNLIPDYVIDCRIRDIQLRKKLEVYPKERRTFLDKNTDIILKEKYIPIKSVQTKDNFVNTLYFLKNSNMEKFMEDIGKNF